MIPQEKAKELVEKFKNRSIELGETHSQLMAEANALIAVNEIIKSNPHKNEFYTQVSSTISYWKEVKQEIEKL